MLLQDFTKKHNIQLQLEINSLCLLGIKFMDEGNDLHHDSNHIHNILDHLDFLLNAKPKLKDHINFSTLLPSICWHDVWIAKQKPKNILDLIRHQIVEGEESAKLWLSHSQHLLPENHTSDVYYCIRKHSSVQFLPAFTLEAKILCDLDKLELWNIKRFLNKNNTIASHKKLYSKYIVRLYFQYSWYTGLYFSELDTKLNFLRNNFYSELS